MVPHRTSPVAFENLFGYLCVLTELYDVCKCMDVFTYLLYNRQFQGCYNSYGEDSERTP